MKKLLFVLAAVSALSLVSCSDDSSSSLPSANLPASVGTNELKGLNLTFGSDSTIVFEDNKVTYSDDGSGTVYNYTYNSEKKEIYLSISRVIMGGLNLDIPQLLDLYSNSGFSDQMIKEMTIGLKNLAILSYEKNDTTVTFTPVYDGTLDSVTEVFDCKIEFKNDTEKNSFDSSTLYFDGYGYQSFPNFTDDSLSGTIYEYEGMVPTVMGTFSGSYVLDNESLTPKLTVTYGSIVSNEPKLTVYSEKTIELELNIRSCTYNIVTE